MKINNLILALMCILALPAWAQDTAPRAEALKPFPLVEKLTQAQFEEQTQAISLAYPDRDAFFKADLRLPKNWKSRPITALKNLRSSERLYGYVAWYDAPGDGSKARAYATIRSIALDHEISAKMWLVGSIYDNAYAMRALREEGLQKAEAIYVTYNELVTYTTWARAEIFGPRIILFEYHVPADIWNKEKDMQIKAAQAFTITGKDKDPIERRRAFSFLDVATFEYPKSWILYRNIIRSPDYFRAALYNQDINLSPSTQITVQAARIGGYVAAQDMTDEEKKFLDKQEFLLRDAIDAPQFLPKKEDIKDPRQFAYQVTGKKGVYDTDIAGKSASGGHEYWLTSFDRGGTSYLVSMLVPARSRIYQDWARATRAYQIIVESLAGKGETEKVRPAYVPSSSSAIPLLDNKQR